MTVLDAIESISRSKPGILVSKLNRSLALANDYAIYCDQCRNVQGSEDNIRKGNQTVHTLFALTFIRDCGDVRGFRGIMIRQKWRETQTIPLSQKDTLYSFFSRRGWDRTKALSVIFPTACYQQKIRSTILQQDFLHDDLYNELWLAAKIRPTCCFSRTRREFKWFATVNTTPKFLQCPK